MRLVFRTLLAEDRQTNPASNRSQALIPVRNEPNVRANPFASVIFLLTIIPEMAITFTECLILIKKPVMFPPFLPFVREHLSEAL